ncbi:G1/S-specific cyclin-D2-like [Coccinella septempunctata]|uniref:G1/S-specific cyclin-D2-like n=1 Tax=Coccinella septempunctata TaxID=41139 RepID=UPI001D08631C|nr:G1/S-specific cyclin-D2-like [Coccinella septempunctata]
MAGIMDLVCCEIAENNENKAYDDPTLLEDRVLLNLLKTEDRYALVCTASFVTIQSEVTQQMRKVVSEWMMEVCEEQKCQEEVYLLAMNYMNRFLNLCNIRKNQLQLLGTTCMMLASKLREPSPIAAETLVYYTDNSITKHDLMRWELLVLSKLKWNLSAVTPLDFVKHLLKRLPVQRIGINLDMVTNHAKTLMALCASEHRFISYHPSMIASACVASALSGIGWESKSGKNLDHLLHLLHKITKTEVDYLEQCLHQVEDMLRMSSISVDVSEDSSYCEPKRPSEFTPPLEKIPEHKTALTPTDVYDVRF